MRELENCMHRAVLMASGDEIGPEAILLQGGGAPGGRVAGRPARSRWSGAPWPTSSAT